MVVVDLTVSCPEPSGTSVLRSRGSGSNPANGAGVLEFGAVAKALKVSPGGRIGAMSDRLVVVWG